jgi:hypothetical protein
MKSKKRFAFELLIGLLLILLTGTLWAQETWTVVYPAIDYGASSQPKWTNGCPAINQLSFIDDPLPGYLTISTGNEGAYTEEVWRDDTTVSYGTGITIEFSAQVNPDSQDTGFFVGWFDAGGDCGVYLGTNHVYVGDATYGGQHLTLATTMVTTTAFHTYRMTRAPSTNKVNLYIDNVAIKTNQTCGGVINGNNYAGYTTNLAYTGRCIWGDNSSPNSKNYTCDVVIDTVRYHPGIEAPSGTDTTGTNTTPSYGTLPWSNITTFTIWSSTTESWDGEYNGTGTPTSEGWSEGGGGQEYNSYFGTSDAGFFTEDGYGNAYINLNGTLDGTSISWDTTGITIEACVQLAPDSPDNGYNILYWTYNGGLGISISTSEVQIGDSSDGCGYDILGPYYFTTTDTFHIYRLTVLPHESVNDDSYASLYIDNALTAVFSNSEGDAEQVAPRIWIGCNNLFSGDQIHADACLQYIRWHRGVTTPAALVPVELSNFYAS